MTNLREAPYSLKDGDVVAVVDRMEDELAQADLTRADDEVILEKKCICPQWLCPLSLLSRSLPACPALSCCASACGLWFV